MSETIERLRNNFLRRKVTFESKGLKVDLGKTMLMDSVNITKDGLSKNNVDPCGVCSLGVEANLLLCLQCGRWIHGRCAEVKMLTTKVSINVTCRCERQWSRKKSYFVKWKQ